MPSSKDIGCIPGKVKPYANVGSTFRENSKKKREFVEAEKYLKGGENFFLLFCTFDCEVLILLPTENEFNFL